MLSLRCWLPEPRRVAEREQMAQRQIIGFFLNGQLLSGFLIWLTSKKSAVSRRLVRRHGNRPRPDELL
jgi:hypothetical protein